MFVTNLISIRVFVIIYRCFIRNYVMIFQNVILNGRFKYQLRIY